MSNLLTKKKLKVLKNILLTITPEIGELLKDINEWDKNRIMPEGTSKEEAAENGIKVILDLLDLLLKRQYDRILFVLSTIYETTQDELEEKEVIEIANMVVETLSDKDLIRFFPRLGPLARKISSATLRE